MQKKLHIKILKSLWRVLTINLTDKIIDYIEENKVSSTEIADILNKTGEINRRIRPLINRLRAVGKVYYAPSFNESNWYTHYFLQSAPKKHIIYVEGINCADRALYGSLVAKYALLYKQSKGIITDGFVRDAHTLIKEEYPIWCWGTTPIGCFKTDTGIDKEYYEKRKQELDGSIIVADDSGVVLVKKEQLTETFLQDLKKIEEQEDIWFDCIDRLKYSTFETVCLRKYENDQK